MYKSIQSDKWVREIDLSEIKKNNRIEGIKRKILVTKTTFNLHYLIKNSIIILICNFFFYSEEITSIIELNITH